MQAQPREFWRQLAARYWERRSIAFAQRAPALWSLPGEELFECLVCCAEAAPPGSMQRLAHRHRSANLAFRFFTVQGSTVERRDMSRACLPRRADGTLEGYHRRLSDALAGRGYSLIINNIIQHDHRLWLAVRDFARGLVREIGMPSRGVTAGFMAGAYARTPFGVHEDDGRSAFIIPVVGTKRYRIWPRSYVQQHPGLMRVLDYSEWLADSLLIDTGPEGLVYWPSDAWHIAEGEEESFTAMVSIGIWIGGHFRSRSEEDEEVVASFYSPAEFDASITVFPFDPGAPQRAVDELPAAYRTLLDKNADRRPRFRDLVIKRWVEQVSSLNLMCPIPERSGALATTRAVRIDPLDPLVWRELSNGVLCIGVNGHSILRRGAWVPDLLSRLNTGEPFAPAELAGWRGSPRGEVESLLGELWRCRGLQPAP